MSWLSHLLNVEARADIHKNPVGVYERGAHVERVCQGRQDLLLLYARCQRERWQPAVMSSTGLSARCSAGSVHSAGTP